MPFKIIRKTTGEEMKNFLITPSGRVFECSETGEQIQDIDKYLKDNTYLDNLDLADITDEVHIYPEFIYMDNTSSSVTSEIEVVNGEVKSITITNPGP